VAKNLGIIVPYRDRAEHLQVFVPHIAAFFSRDAKAVGGNISITIVEQEHGLEFNRGLVNNIGYFLSKNLLSRRRLFAGDYSEPNGILLRSLGMERNACGDDHSIGLSYVRS
jgi:hypothetical protein